MKKSIFVLSSIVNIFTFIVTILFILNTKVISDKIIFILFIFLSMTQFFANIKLRKTKFSLNKYEFPKTSDLKFIIIALITLILNVYLTMQLINGKYNLNLFTVLVIIYVISLKFYDVNHIYYDKTYAYYSVKKIDLIGIEKISYKKTLIAHKLTIYYKNRDSINITTFFKKNIECIEEFLNTHKRKK